MDEVIEQPRTCENGCAIVEDENADDYNPLLSDGYCQGCHDYPEG